jgi:hypothetical protein
MNTKELKKMPYTIEELKFIDSIRKSYKNCYVVDREEIIYYPIKFFDKKSDYIINIEIRDRLEKVNAIKLSKDASSIIFKAKRLIKDENKIQNYFVKFKIIKPLMIKDSILKDNNSNKYYYPSILDTIIEYKSKNN